VVPVPLPVVDVDLDLSMRNSCASARTRLRCLSKARNVPVMVRESESVIRSLCSTYRSSLDPFPLGCD
jgi:hypothetical protein